VAGETLAGLSTVEQLAQITPPLRDLRRLVQQLNGPATAAPLTVAGAPPAYAIDDQESFSVRNTSTNRVTEISATLVYSTPVAYIWVQSDQEFDRAGLQRSADRFSSITYPNVVNAFGSEWRPGVDNDERLHILYNVAMGDGVSGYFSGSDEYTRAVLPFSNQKEMFYINLLAINRSQNYAALDTTLAHELQHMIHWHMDRGEELWINEGLSEYAQQVAEFAVGGAFTAAFTADPDLQLTSWGTVNGNRPHYGAAYLFIVYLAQQFGPPAIANLVADPDNGMSSVTNALASVGAELDGEQLFADWVAANYADQALAEDGRYGYQELDPPAPAVAAQHVQFPVAPQQGTVGNFATDYIELAGAGDVVFTFAGATATALAAAELAAGERAWWANRADDADARLLARYDLSGLAAQTPLTLTASMWWDIESDYDFGYVMASSDGEYWRLLPGAHMSSDNASGNAFGPAYTGHSGDSPDSAAWVEESFDLSAYAGGPLSLRFSYITDDALNQAGWLMKDVQLTGPAGVIAPLGADGLRADDLGADDLGAGWQSEGWLLTDNRLPQRWLLQVLEFDGDTLTAVRRVPSDAQGRAEAEITGLGNGRRAVVAISGLSPVTTLPAQYEYTITSKN
jgi:immune inhibitor A